MEASEGGRPRPLKKPLTRTRQRRKILCFDQIKFGQWKSCQLRIGKFVLVTRLGKPQGFSLEHLRFLVVDEADRVMEDIQNDWLNQVEGAVYSSGKRPRPGEANMIFYHGFLYETQEFYKPSIFCWTTFPINLGSFGPNFDERACPTKINIARIAAVT